MSSFQQPSAVSIKKRACVNCTAGKAKCSPFSGNECERCHRLGKECTYLNIINKRKSPKSSSRVQLLERKVDGLLSRLERQSQGSVSVKDILQDGSAVENERTSNGSSLNRSRTSSYAGTATSQQASSETNLTEIETSDIVDRGLITLETAQKLLDDFRSEAVQHFPFVIIPPRISLASVRHDTPFLFLCIMTSMMVNDCRLQRQLGEEIRIYIHHKMLLGFSKSLELLQGLLVYLTWYQFHYFPQKQQIILLAQFCVTLVSELGLDKNPKNRRRKADLELGEPESDGGYSRTPAEIRALLGTYCTASWVATKFRRRSSMAHTKHIEQSSLYLAEIRECPTDELILHLVRLHELSRRVHDTFSFDDLVNTEVQNELITRITTQSFIHELENQHNTIPKSLKDNIALDLEFHLLKASINEVAIHEEFWGSPTVSRSSISEELSLPSTLRSSMLYSFIQACKELMNSINTYPNHGAFYYTYYTLAKICYILTCFAKLVHLRLDTIGRREPDGGNHPQTLSHVWNSIPVEREAELPSLVRQLQEKLHTMAIEISNREDELDAMTMFSLMVDTMMSGYEKRIKEIYTSSSTQIPTIGESNILDDSRFADLPSTLPNFQPDARFYGTLLPELFNQDAGLQLDAFEDMVWDSLLDDFTFPS